MSSHHLEPDQLPDVAPHNHGKTPAAWATNAGVTLGAVVAGVGLMIPTAPVVWVGGAVVLVALVAGAILRALGHGQPLN